MKKETEKLVTQMNDARLINASEHLLYPMIDKMIQDRVDVACSRFAGGDKDFIGDIAYIQGLKLIKSQLRNLQSQGNKAHAELNKD